MSSSPPAKAGKNNPGDLPAALQTPQAQRLEESMALDLAIGLSGVHAQLEEGLRALLERGQNRRVQHLLYRVDVDEQQALRLWRTTPPEALPGALADLIIARLEEIARSNQQRRYPVDPEDAW